MRVYTWNDDGDYVRSAVVGRRWWTHCGRPSPYQPNGTRRPFTVPCGFRHRPPTGWWTPSAVACSRTCDSPGPIVHRPRTFASAWSEPISAGRPDWRTLAATRSRWPRSGFWNESKRRRYGGAIKFVFGGLVFFGGRRRHPVAYVPRLRERRPHVDHDRNQFGVVRVVFRTPVPGFRDVHRVVAVRHSCGGHKIRRTRLLLFDRPSTYGRRRFPVIT